ncbi:hypothetical protein [Sphingomonas sp. 3-13AW]|uniref:hypothetical protein n=1 Tax=Sphingomonas sp. 3-13AW TaxID=3050450 RepID=UPI003BB507D6
MHYAPALAALLLLGFGVFGPNPLNVLAGLTRRALGLRMRLVHGRRIAVLDGSTIRFRHNRFFGLLGYDFVTGQLRGINAPDSGAVHGPASIHALRAILVHGGRHLAISCCRDVHDREMMWLIGLKGPVGLRLLWQGQAFAATRPGKPVALLARLLRRGMWGKRKITDTSVWRLRNHHWG